MQHTRILESTIGSQMSMQPQCDTTYVGILRKPFSHIKINNGLFIWSVID